jgi:hypothetical protein
MFWTISAITFVLWVLGMVSGAHLGWWVHLLLSFSLASGTLALLQSGRTLSTEEYRRW